MRGRSCWAIAAGAVLGTLGLVPAASAATNATSAHMPSDPLSTPAGQVQVGTLPASFEQAGLSGWRLAASGSATGSKGSIGSFHGSGTVPLQVESNQEATVALAVVTIDGKTPYAFIVDSGASNTVITQAAATALGLKPSGGHQRVATVGCTVNTMQTKLDNWSVSGVRLPPVTANIVNAANTSPLFGGLLGSDVLSQFGVAAIYQHQRLSLGTAVHLNPTDATVVPLRVLQRDGAVVAIAPISVQHHGPYPFIVDTGASQSAVNQRLAQSLHLTVRSPSGSAKGVSCTTHASTVAVSSWQAGSVQLPTKPLLSISLPRPAGPASPSAIPGLLGSNVLSSFGTVAINYAHSQLLLAARTTK